jgi:hypothetical protein
MVALSTFASVALPCEGPGVRHYTTRERVTLSDGSTSDVEIHDHHELGIDTSQIGVIDGRGQRLAIEYKSVRATRDTTIDIKEKPFGRTFLAMSYNLSNTKAGSPTTVSIRVRGKTYTLVFTGNEPPPDAQKAVYDAVLALPPRIVSALRNLYSLTEAKAMPALPPFMMLYFAVPSLPEGIKTVSTVDLNEAEVASFKAKFAEASDDSEWDKDKGDKGGSGDKQLPGGKPNSN